MYTNKLGVEIEFNDPLTGTIIHTTEPQPHTYAVKLDKLSSLNIALHPANKTSYEKKGKEQPWTVEFFSLHQQDHERAKESQLIYKKWKNIPDIMFSINGYMHSKYTNLPKMQNQS